MGSDGYVTFDASCRLIELFVDDFFSEELLNANFSEECLTLLSLLNHSDSSSSLASSCIYIGSNKQMYARLQKQTYPNPNYCLDPFTSQ